MCDVMYNLQLANSTPDTMGTKKADCVGLIH